MLPKVGILLFRFRMVISCWYHFNLAIGSLLKNLIGRRKEVLCWKIHPLSFCICYNNSAAMHFIHRLFCLPEELTLISTLISKRYNLQFTCRDSWASVHNLSWPSAHQVIHLEWEHLYKTRCHPNQISPCFNVIDLFFQVFVQDDSPP